MNAELRSNNSCDATLLVPTLVVKRMPNSQRLSILLNRRARGKVMTRLARWSCAVKGKKGKTRGLVTAPSQSLWEADEAELVLIRRGSSGVTIEAMVGGPTDCSLRVDGMGEEGGLMSGCWRCWRQEA